ncbi:uncharacterized protein LOC121510947 [Cheilinus undulatus]|uniref:uncharacterized protein LOC121510947 n=1 Tax=Cheilinus undulatus TaxID=241271 RepID=UPI001BD4EC77|nr:uncharacterized protein LOC121510947 [Cheilinus undulatus]
MSGRRFSESWLLVGDLTWDECYAICKKDGHFQEDSNNVVTATETEIDNPGEDDPVVQAEEVLFCSTSVKRYSTSDDYIPLSTTPPPPLCRSPKRRSITPTKWRRRRAAASHPYKARRHCGYRAPVSRRRSCGCCCNCSRRREWLPRRRRYTLTPRVSSWEHLPVAIQPTKWYQVVGSMQCSHCKAKGRYQMTSWMCQMCEEPLCLMPFRNCYALWHGQRF